MSKKNENAKVNNKVEVEVNTDTKVNADVKAEVNTDVKAEVKTDTPVEVIPVEVADLVENASLLVGKANLDKAEKVTGLMGIEKPAYTYQIDSEDGVRTIEITDIRDITAIQRIKAATGIEKLTNLVIAANLGEMTRNGGLKRCGVKSAAELCEKLSIPISGGKQVAAKLARVGAKFLHLDENGVPKYNDGVPQLSVFNLDYLTKFVEEKDDGSYDYKALAEFIDKNGINAATTQKDLKALTTTKKTPEPTGEDEKKTDGEKIAITATSRISRLQECFESVAKIEQYNIDYLGKSEEITAAMAAIAVMLNKEMKQYKTDILDVNKAGDWD